MKQRLQFDMITLDDKKSLKIIRYVIISLIIGSFLGIVIDEFLQPAGHENSLEVESTIKTTSGFGEITLFERKNVDIVPQNLYRNEELGFQISKPSNKWAINSIFTGNSDEENVKWREKGLLDGIYVEQNNDKRFMVAIFDVKQKDTFQLNDYINDQIQQLQYNDDITIPFRHVSELNDWAIFAIQENSVDSSYYGEQLLYFKDGRLYMLLYTGPSPQTLDPIKKSEFHFIMDSFEIMDPIEL